MSPEKTIANITIDSVEIMGERSAVFVVSCQPEGRPNTFQLQFSELLSQFDGMSQEEIKSLIVERIAEGVKEVVNSQKQLTADGKWLASQALAGKGFRLEMSEEGEEGEELQWAPRDLPRL